MRRTSLGLLRCSWACLRLSVGVSGWLVLLAGVGVRLLHGVRAERQVVDWRLSRQFQQGDFAELAGEAANPDESRLLKRPEPQCDLLGQKAEV